MSSSSYSLRIESRVGLHDGPFDDGQDSSVGPGEPLDDDGAADIEFSAGNPRVEHITGVVHLYRNQQMGEESEDVASSSSASTSGPATYAQTVARSKGAHAGSSGGGAAFGDMLCCLAIPADMSVAEFCTFCGAYLQHIREMRVLRREAAKRVVCMVLVRFDSADSAHSFFDDTNNKPFCSLEPEILCRLVRVRDVEVLAPRSGSSVGDARLGPDSSSSGPPGNHPGPSCSSLAGASDARQPRPKQLRNVPSAHMLPPAGSLELPSCPVCLERLDEHVSGIVTTVCNHQFHSQCLQKWGDTSCPVCRYCSQPGGTHSSRCSVCSSTGDLWICLICGHVGCGRYKDGHAIDHFKSSQHCYALELETQRVWDYVGDNYVHRLIASKTDGKLVEVPSPVPQSTRARPTASCSMPPGIPEECMGSDDDSLKEALVSSKLDAIADDYNHLLTTQLDSQRHYFEGLLSAQAKDAEKRVAAAEAEACKAVAAATQACSRADEADRKRHAAEQKLADATQSLKKESDEKQFLRSLNDTLLANQKDFQGQLNAAKSQMRDKDEAIKDLQEQVRDLMVFIEAQRVVEASGGELRDASATPGPERPPPRRSKAR